MARILALLIATIAALALIGRLPSSVVTQAEQRVRTSLPSFQSAASPTCRAHDRSLVQLDVSLGNDLAPGRVFSQSDGTLAVLIVIAEANDAGKATAIDFAASLRISAIIVQSNVSSELRAFDPPVRNGSNIRAAGGGAIDQVSFCYRVTFPAPPQPEQPGATPTEAEPGTTVTAEAASPTPTALTLDLSGAQTASARAAASESTATVAAATAAAEIATANARAAEIAASSTAAAEAAAATVAAQETSIAQASAELATAEANAAAAKATAAALQATLAAPTATSTPSPTAPAPATVVAYQTVGVTPFADWEPVNGWDLSGSVAKTDGSTGRQWLVVPVPSGLSPDEAVEIEFRVTGGDMCPRNFGVGIRISEAGYDAGGIEWACEPEAVFWSGSRAVVKRPLAAGTDLGDGWHTMRVAAIGDQVTIAIDGDEVILEHDSEVMTGNLVGIWSDGVGLEIRSVKVFEVAP